MDIKQENIFTIKLNKSEIDTLRMILRSTLAKETPSYSESSINFRNEILQLITNFID